MRLPRDTSSYIRTLGTPLNRTDRDRKTYTQLAYSNKRLDATRRTATEVEQIICAARATWIFVCILRDRLFMT